MNIQLEAMRIYVHVHCYIVKEHTSIKGAVAQVFSAELLPFLEYIYSSLPLLDEITIRLGL
jgi:hypothetical protein